MQIENEQIKSHLENSASSPKKPPKIQVHVKINPTDDIHVFEKESNAVREPSGTASQSSMSSKSSSRFMEPQSIFEVIHSFLTNSYVEAMATIMSLLAILMPNYVTLVLTILTQVLMIGIPSHLFQDQTRKRLSYYSLATIFLLAIVVLSFLYKVYLTFSYESMIELQSWGIYVDSYSKNELNVPLTFFYESIVIVLLLTELYITNSITKEHERSRKLKVMTKTYLGCLDFSQHRKIYKYLFVAFTAVELLLVPDILALPILFFFLILLIFAVIYTTKDRNNETVVHSSNDSDFVKVLSYEHEKNSLLTWAMKNERLFTLTMEWQKLFMMIQLFEFILMNTFSVKQELKRELVGQSPFSFIFLILRLVGHAEFQQVGMEVIDTLHYQLLFLTVAIIFLAQISTKAYAQHKRFEQQIEQFDENALKPMNSEASMNTQQEDRLIDRINKKMYKTFSRSEEVTMDEFQHTLVGFMPILLCWLLRITMTVFVYMYNSYVSFFHLIWILTSFFLSTGWFYHVSVLLLFPVVCIEFCLVYIANISSFQSSFIFKLPILKEYYFKAVSPFWELMLMFSILVMLGLMVPARIRYMSYDRHHKGGDMIKDLIVRKIKSPDSFVLWKLGFIFILSMHNVIIFFMLFAGNQKFNLFQLGFMFFFVAYSASEFLYQKTSILLPIFISFFISAQYYWSVQYTKHKETYHERDFLNMIDGWEPSDGSNFYWSRLPSLKLWALLIVMNALHSVARMFPDYDQNEKYIEECDKQISRNYPRLTKYAKRTKNIVFMIVLVVLFFIMARDLISQKPNLFNLIYLILFMIVFGKMCMTSIDGNSTKECLRLAKYIRRYSAVVLSVIVIYHMLRFEFFDFDDWFAKKKAEKNFFILYLQLIGFGEDEIATTNSVQLYTAYLIVGQILHKYFHDSVRSQEDRDLFNWSEAFKTAQGVKKANEYFRFNNQYFIYNLMPLWPLFDDFCTYFHLVTNGVIVYFSITVSVSLFYAIHLALIIFFYCYSSFKLNEAAQGTLSNKEESITLDLQEATDLCRSYKKLSHEIFLRIRKRLWMTQYAITMLFVFASYLDPMILQMIAQAEGERLETLKTLQFYMYWIGVTYNKTERDSSIEELTHIQGLQPVHIIILFILFEKQTQNWLYSRWGLNKTMISKFVQLEFFLSIDKKESHLLPVSQVNNCHEIFKYEMKEYKPALHQNGSLWSVEDYSNAIISAWRSVKLHSLIKTAIGVGIRDLMTSLQRNKPKGVLKNRLQAKSIFIQLFEDDQVDTMTLHELILLEKELKAIFQIDLNLAQKFHKLKVRIEGNEIVKYQLLKRTIEAKLHQLKMVNTSEITFLSHSQASSLKRTLTSSLKSQFSKAALQYNLNNNIDVSEKIISNELQIKLSSLHHELKKMIDRRYSYEMWSGLRLIFEQISLILLLSSVIIKCNIVSLIYLILVTNYLVRQSKQRAMRNQVYIISSVLMTQYLLYLLNLTSQSSPTPFPEMPYPNTDFPYGKHLIPLMYKFKFARNIRNAYFFSLGVEIFIVQTLWIDFWNVALVAMYLFYYRNPVLSHQCKKIVWAHKKEDSLSRLEEGKLNFWSSLEEYTRIMNIKYPSERSLATQAKQLKGLKESSTYYVVVKNASVLIYTTCHIFTMFVILLMALCRRSLISLGYVLALIPYLKDSRSVLNQHEQSKQCKAEIEELTSNPEFQLNHTPEQQRELISDVRKKYEWSFINLLCFYLSIYSFMDFFCQVLYQVPYIPDIKALELFGLRKIYPPQSDSFDYASYISGNYHAPELNYSNLLTQFLNCIILCTISTQSEIFKSQGYQSFIKREDGGLGQLMQLAKLKKLAITYSYNNQKLSKILAIQKTKEQIWGTVERIKVNMVCFKRSLQRQMLEEYQESYEDIGLPERTRKQAIIKQEPVEEEKYQEPYNQLNLKQLHIRLAAALDDEKERREKLIHEQSQVIIETLLPMRASFYLRMLQLSENIIFIKSQKEMKRMVSDMEQGKKNLSVDLLRFIHSDLHAILCLHEQESGDKLREWPEMSLKSLKKTENACRWQNIIPKCFAAAFKVVISNTQFITYCFMISSLFTNAGIVSIIYPFAVFGLALLEEKRPGKSFWRFFLSYSLTILFLKYISNLRFMGFVLNNTYFVTIDGYMKLGLHHMPKTKELVLHMLPEMLIVASILCHEIVEQLTGLYKTSESDVETLPQAIERIFKSNSKKIEQQTEISNWQAQQPSEEPTDPEQPAWMYQGPKMRQEIHQHPEFSNTGGFWGSSYFQRLFPKIQQQKPGTDYYGWLTVTQMGICYYLLQKFNLFSATGPYQETNIFQDEMVVILFYMFGCIILERYVARTEHKIVIERNKKTDQALKPTIKQEKLFEPNNDIEDLTVKLVIQKFLFQDLREMESMDTLYRLKQQQETDIIMYDTFITTQQKVKFLLHWLNLVLVHLYVFWYLPTQANLKLYGTPTCNEDMTYGCREFRYNPYLQNFYLLYVLYFFFSAKQIGEGMPNFHRGSTTMLNESKDTSLFESLIVNVLHQVYVNIPMMMECRTLLDYCLGKTTLDLWWTNQIFQYHSDFYIAKLANREYNVKELGKPISIWNKLFYGPFCAMIVMSLVIGPFFLFSGMGGMTAYNPVQASNLQIWVEVNETTSVSSGDWVDRMSAGTQSFPVKIYENEAPALYEFDHEMFENHGFSQWAETKFFDAVQLQAFLPNRFSDNTWIASDQVRQTLQKYSCIASMQTGNETLPQGCLQFVNTTNVQNVQIGFQLRMQFDRQQPSGATTAFGVQQRNLDPTDDRDKTLLNLFSAVMNENCSSTDPPTYTLNITDFHQTDLVLGQTTDVTPLAFSSNLVGQNQKQNLLLTYRCKDQWAIGTGQQGAEKPLELVLFSQRVQIGWLQGYSILAFYTGMILTLGGYLRPIFIFGTHRAFIYETNYPDCMLRLCESVHLARAQGDLVTEEFNFRMLQDILRSPELLHHLTGSNMKGLSIAPTQAEQWSRLIQKAYK